MEKEILGKVLECIDVEKLVGEVVLEEIIYAKIDELVADSANTLDDSIAAMLKPLLKKAVVDYLVELIADLKKEPAQA